jgi:predicted transcriptional regulator of viral defense system
MRGELATDQAIAALAETQAGVVEHRQLRRMGLTSSAIGRRMEVGRLHQIYRGVYAVGHRAPAADGRFWAAVLACGPDGVLSHASAGAAWDLRRSDSPTIDVTVGLGGRARRPGIRLHRTRSLPADEIATVRDLPVTTAARTVLDLAATGLRGRPLEAALDRAELLGALDFDELRVVLERYPRRRGSPAVAAVLARYSAPTITRSELEERFLALCDRFDLPRPTVNCVIEGSEVDFFWPGAGLIVEVDGYAWHRSPSAMRSDHERDVMLTLAGYRVLRFTWEDVTRRPAYVTRSVRRALLRVKPA